MTAPPPFAAIPPRGLPELKEHDACALAGFATRDGRPSRAMLERALTSLEMMVHRSGSVDGEGDGSGLMVDLPRPTWRRRLEAEGLDPAAGRRPALHGRPHLLRLDGRCRGPGAAHRGAARRRTASRCCGAARGRSTAARSGRARPRRRRSSGRSPAWPREPGDAASTACYRAMVEIERELDCHVASFSANDALYKVQGQPEVIPRFYPEMQEPDFASSRIIAHNRYSTNTYPTFSRVQPFSILGHNGEINTIAQLREQSEQLGLPITRDGSDSQDLNRLLEGLIFEKGLSLLEAVEFALPPILGEVHRLPAKLQDLYVHYREALGPYAQGPVALACRAGDEMVFAVDAIGLRPLWWIETEDLYVVSSEPGIVPVAELTRDPAPLAPGEKVALLTGEDGVPVVLDYWEVQREVYRRAKGRGALPDGRDARPPGRRPRAGRGRGVPRRGPPRARARARDPARLGRAGSRATSSSSSSTPTAAPSRSARSAGTGRWGRSRRCRCRSRTTSRRPSRSSPTRPSTASARSSTSRPASCSAGARRSRASSPSRPSAASCGCPSSSAACAPAPAPSRCRRCGGWPSARASPAWRTCSPPGTGAPCACRCTSPAT